MRITGGSEKGRRIGFRKAFSWKEEEDELRPTASKVREALFNIIKKEIPGALFLDLYAGTGGVGIEALSRGASKAVMVESNALRVRMIRHLLSEFNLLDRSRVVNAQAFGFLAREARKRCRYDIIFLDPPYGSEELPKILPVIGEGKVLKEGATVIAEHFHKTRLPVSEGRLRLLKSYKYGDTMLTVYKAVAL